jgi:hypothetical protein
MATMMWRPAVWGVTRNPGVFPFVFSVTSQGPGEQVNDTGTIRPTLLLAVTSVGTSTGTTVGFEKYSRW